MRYTENPRAGDLARPVSFQSASSSADALGQATLTWTTYLACRAAIRTLSGRENLQSQQMQQVSTHMIEVRWPGSAYTVLPTHRVLHGSQILNLVTVNNVGFAQRKLECMANEVIGPAGGNS